GRGVGHPDPDADGLVSTRLGRGAEGGGGGAPLGRLGRRGGEEPPQKVVRRSGQRVTASIPGGVNNAEATTGQEGLRELTKDDSTSESDRATACDNGGIMSQQSRRSSGRCTAGPA